MVQLEALKVSLGELHHRQLETLHTELQADRDKLLQQQREELTTVIDSLKQGQGTVQEGEAGAQGGEWG